MSNKEHIERLEALRQFTMGFDDSIDFAISAIKGTESKTEWISVEDKLPPTNKLVLLASEIEYHIGIRMGYNNILINNYGQSLMEKRITHWRPLPEPPKE